MARKFFNQALLILVIPVLAGCLPKLERTLPGDLKNGKTQERRSVLGRLKASSEGQDAAEMNRNRLRQSVDIWFVRAESSSQGDKFEFIPEARPYHCPSGSDRATADALEFAVNELLRGPASGHGESSEIPLGTVLISVHDIHPSDKAVKAGKGGLVIDLSRHFLAGGGLESMETRLEQLKRTINGVAAQPVYLDVEGRRVSETPGDGIPVPQPLNQTGSPGQE